MAFDISADQAGASMANLMTALGLTIDETVSLADAMNHLSNSQASSAADILDVVRRVGAQATLFGFSAEETSAFASAMLAAGAQSEVAATSFRNLGAALTRGSAATRAQREAFQELGLDAEAVARRMQEDAVGTTLDVLRRISQIPREQQAAISSQLFGNEARALGPLLTNLGLVEDTLGMVDREQDYARVAEKLAESDDVLFLGRGAMFPMALEAALKLKEISYIHAEAYAAGELKHGPIALIEKTLPVIIFAPKDVLFEKTISNMQEVMARHGQVTLLTDAEGAKLAGEVQNVIVMPKAPAIVAPLVYAIPAQMLAYNTALARGTDVDQPRNLAKSVTVE